MFDIGKGEHCPITGIEFHKVPNTGRYIVLVTTVNRMYKFHETIRVDERPPYLQVELDSQHLVKAMNCEDTENNLSFSEFSTSSALT